MRTIAKTIYLPISLALLSSCSDFSADLKGEAVLDYGNSTGTILTCTDKLDGKVVKPADGSEYRLCKDGQWFAVEIGDFDEADVIKPTAKSSSSEKENAAASSSSQKNEASKQSSSSKKVIVFDENDDDELLPSKQSSSSDKTAPSSSSATNVPASSAIVTPPEKIEISSSSKDKPTSSWSSEAAIGSSSSSVAIAASSSSKVVIFEPDDPIVSPIVSSSSAAPKSSSSAVAKSSSSGVVAKSSSSTTVVTPSSSSITKPVSSSSEKIAEPEPESSSEDTVKSSSSKDPVENLYICEDGETIVENIDNCPENQEPESSSSEEANSSSSEDEVDEPEPESSSEAVVDPNAKYDCTVYNCVTTEYLNQEMLAAGKYGELLDERDNQVYRTIKIGEQTWMAQNLNYSYNSKYGITFCQDNDPTCDSFGRMYPWSVAIDSSGLFSNDAKGCGYFASCTINEPVRGICPEGWHIPSKQEISDLLDYVGGDEEERSISLRSKQFNEGSDSYGFSAIGTGGFDFRGDNKSHEIDTLTRIWTSGSPRSYFADYLHIEEKKSLIFAYAPYVSVDKDYASSVRCIKDVLSEEDPELSSSSEETVEPESSSTAEVPSAKYDCTKYNCVTTEYLNQEMLAEGNYGEFLDERDNQVYRTIKIGDQVWMAQNLNYVTDGGNADDKKGSWCYNNEPSNCTLYGRYYKWTVAMDIDSKYESSSYVDSINHQGICPSGWHIPSGSDWMELFNSANKNGDNLKTTEFSNWGSPTNSVGFSAIPAGHYFVNLSSIAFNSLGADAAFWTSNEENERFAYWWYISEKETRISYHGGTYSYIYSDAYSRNYKYMARNIRCLMDRDEKASSSSTATNPVTKYDCSEYNCVTTEYLNQEMLAAGKYGELLDERDNQVYRTIKIGEQTWMAQNLNYNSTGSTYFDNKEIYGPIYGRLYNWSAAKNACPENWHIPTNDEFRELFALVGGAETKEFTLEISSWPKYTSFENSATALKSMNYNWEIKGDGDIYGFSAISSGFRWDYGKYDNLETNKRIAHYWTTTTISGGRYIVWRVGDNETFANLHYDLSNYMYAIRCIQN